MEKKSKIYNTELCLKNGDIPNALLHKILSKYLTINENLQLLFVFRNFEIDWCYLRNRDLYDSTFTLSQNNAIHPDNENSFEVKHLDLLITNTVDMKTYSLSDREFEAINPGQIKKNPQGSKSKIKCSICKQEGHNKRSCKTTTTLVLPKVEIEADVRVIAPVKIEMSRHEYDITIAEIEIVAKSICVKKSDCDGRIDSAMKETPFLNEMKRILLEKQPGWEVVISPPRASCDMMVNSIRINLKLTDCKSSDNSVNKGSIYYSITGESNYPYHSNWNDFLDRINDAKTKNEIKKQRFKSTEYHYLVKNKLTGDVLLKPIFDIHTYVSNASNDLQINWKNEFVNSHYQTEDSDYLKKVKSLLVCIQKSVKEMIERTKRYAEADVNSLFILEQ